MLDKLRSEEGEDSESDDDSDGLESSSIEKKREEEDDEDDNTKESREKEDEEFDASQADIEAARKAVTSAREEMRSRDEANTGWMEQLGHAGRAVVAVVHRHRSGCCFGGKAGCSTPCLLWGFLCRSCCDCDGREVSCEGHAARA